MNLKVLGADSEPLITPETKFLQNRMDEGVKLGKSGIVAFSCSALRLYVVSLDDWSPLLHANT